MEYSLNDVPDHVSYRAKDRIEAVWKKLGGEERVERFLRGELGIVERSCRWQEKNGVIYFSVTSDGTTGPEWVERLKARGILMANFSNHTKILHSPDFKPTSGITTRIAMFKGVSDNDPPLIDALAKGVNDGLLSPKAEVACLIREALSNEKLKAMGLWRIVVMHNPIKVDCWGPDMLTVERDFWLPCSGCIRYNERLGTISSDNNARCFWRGLDDDAALAFAISQVDLKTLETYAYGQKKPNFFRKYFKNKF